MSYTSRPVPDNTPSYAASLCIPRAFHRLTWKDVKSSFETAFNAPDCVQKVDLISRTDDQNRPFKRIFVHFKFWPDNEMAKYAMDRMTSVDGGTFQLVYNEPWYWKCSLSRVAPPSYTTKYGGGGGGGGGSSKSAPFVSVVDVVAPDTHDVGGESDDGEIDEAENFNSKSVEEAILDATES